jgi:hypothetical protein
VLNARVCSRSGSANGQLSISVASVANSHNVNKLLAVVNAIDHAVIANANPPEIPRADQLSGAGWTRAQGERFDTSQDARAQISR